MVDSGAKSAAEVARLLRIHIRVFHGCFPSRGLWLGQWHNSPKRDICPVGLYAPLFIGGSIRATALGNRMQEGGK